MFGGMTKRDEARLRRNVLPKSIEICMEPPCWSTSVWAPTWRPETNRNICHWVSLREFISRGTREAVMQKLKNSSVLYHKTKDQFWVKICINTSFQQLLYIMKVKFQAVNSFLVWILVTSCENPRVKLEPGGRVGSYADLPFCVPRLVWGFPTLQSIDTLKKFLSMFLYLSTFCLPPKKPVKRN